jgi:hypothetical protein
MVLLSALCELPDALNLQHALMRTFEPGVRSIGWLRVQTPYAPDTGPVQPLYPHWVLVALHLAFTTITFLVRLVALCAIKRIKSGTRKARVLNETIEIYRDAIALTPAFLMIALLQVIAIAVGFVLLVIPGLLAIVWLYFASFALVFDHRHSWHALLYSRDLTRGRLLKVAVRIIVFLAVWSGFNGWVWGAFFGLGLLIGPIALIAGVLPATIFFFSVIEFAVTYTTIAFFIAAGARLYQDLQAITAERMVAAQDASLPATAPLPNLAPAAK